MQKYSLPRGGASRERVCNEMNIQYNLCYTEKLGYIFLLFLTGFASKFFNFFASYRRLRRQLRNQSKCCIFQADRLDI